MRAVALHVIAKGWTLMAMAMPAVGTPPVTAQRLAARLDIHHHPSPNCGPRRGGVLPDIVVLHYTAMTGAEAALDRLCDPAAEVSAHYLICERGRVWQMVPEAQRAWHAGAGAWGGGGPSDGEPRAPRSSNGHHR